jgi:hypothetical protein
MLSVSIISPKSSERPSTVARAEQSLHCRAQATAPSIRPAARCRFGLLLGAFYCWFSTEGGHPACFS